MTGRSAGISYYSLLWFFSQSWRKLSLPSHHLALRDPPSVYSNQVQFWCRFVFVSCYCINTSPKVLWMIVNLFTVRKSSRDVCSPTSVITLLSFFSNHPHELKKNTENPREFHHCPLQSSGEIQIILSNVSLIDGKWFSSKRTQLYEDTAL